MIRDAFGKEYPLTHHPKFRQRAVGMLAHRFPVDNSEIEWLAENLEFYSKEQYGFPDVDFNKFSKPLIDAVLAIRKYGKLIGVMRGGSGWNWKWQNPEVTVKPPSGVTLKALIKRSFLFMMSRHAHPVSGECLFTDNWEEYHESNYLRPNLIK